LGADDQLGPPRSQLQQVGDLLGMKQHLVVIPPVHDYHHHHHHSREQMPHGQMPFQKRVICRLSLLHHLESLNDKVHDGDLYSQESVFSFEIAQTELMFPKDLDLTT
jgi:hypothetical protein